MKSFHNQSDRLSKAGYPVHVHTSVAECLLRKLCNPEGAVQHCVEKPKHLVVIPYHHKILHNVKRLAKRSEVGVVFSAPKKLASLCRLHYRNGKPKGCDKKHQTAFVSCTIGVVYRIPLSCARQYIGQTGRCLNYRLREHCNNVKMGRLDGQPFIVNPAAALCSSTHIQQSKAIKMTDYCHHSHLLAACFALHRCPWYLGCEEFFVVFRCQFRYI